MEIHKNDPDSNVSKHFNSADNSTNDMNISGFTCASTDTIKLKTLQKRNIFKLGTLFPAGLNRPFLYI